MSEYIEARCPECNRLLSECCEGSRIRTVCTRCKSLVMGAVVKGKFVATTAERKKSNPPRITTAVSPPMLTG